MVIILCPPACQQEGEAKYSSQPSDLSPQAANYLTFIPQLAHQKAFQHLVPYWDACCTLSALLLSEAMWKH
ncbi:hypothetical protein Y1Q_0011051 [Alligator mississippiensis]|uniref:Uncharacterized protein n=1 Tax=Alligator mississippiensis TaxID=8496 RepID=A0A151NX20_ALLMI|nr:hypothetical protein Y1Q_0011051 [Alligator mississippiensis]